MKLLKGQSIAEYALLVVSITAAVMGFRVFVMRAVEANIAELEGRYQPSGVVCIPDPCSPNPCPDLGPCCNPVSPYFDEENCCNPDPCDPIPCPETVGFCCDSTSAQFDPVNCCDSVNRCSTDPDHPSCVPAPELYCESGCSVLPCQIYDEDISSGGLCSTECAECVSDCTGPINEAASEECDQRGLDKCERDAANACYSQAQDACSGLSNCCAQCPGSCSNPDSKLRRGRFMLAGVSEGNQQDGWFTLSAVPGGDCYRDCINDYNSCIWGWLDANAYNCTSLDPLAGCSGSCGEDVYLPCITNLYNACSTWFGNATACLVYGNDLDYCLARETADAQEECRRDCGGIN